MKFLFTIFLLFCSATLFSQSATYKLVNKKTGAYNNISVRQTDDLVEVNILANWNNKSGTYGQFNGKGTLVENQCILHGENNGLPCKVTLIFSDDKLIANFQNCNTYQIHDFFSGSYTKIADNIPGDYAVTAYISYFYSKPDDKTRKKGFIKQSEILHVEELFEGNWGFATFMTEGKHNFGYVKLSDLKLKKTYIYD